VPEQRESSPKFFIQIANTNSAKRYDRFLKANGISKATNNDAAKDLHGAGGSDGELHLPLLEETIILTHITDDIAAGTAEQESPKKRKAATGKSRGKGAAKKIKVEEQIEIGDEDEAEVEF